MARKQAKADGILPALMKPVRVALDGLVTDPRNARVHDDENVEAIRSSLARFGQHRPLVVQMPGQVVRIGNGALRAMRELGWTHAAAILVSEDDATAIARAVADNRTGELSTWDDTILAGLLADLPADLASATGFSERALKKLAKSAERAAATAATPAPPDAEPLRHSLMVHLYVDADQKAEIERLTAALGPAFETDNLTDVVLEALREAWARRNAQDPSRTPDAR